jgi:hypothetical protein
MPFRITATRITTPWAKPSLLRRARTRLAPSGLSETIYCLSAFGAKRTSGEAAQDANDPKRTKAGSKSRSAVVSLPRARPRASS